MRKVKRHLLYRNRNISCLEKEEGAVMGNFSEKKKKKKIGLVAAQY